MLGLNSHLVEAVTLKKSGEKIEMIDSKENLSPSQVYLKMRKELEDSNNYDEMINTYKRYYSEAKIKSDKAFVDLEEGSQDAKDRFYSRTKMGIKILYASTKVESEKIEGSRASVFLSGTNPLFTTAEVKMVKEKEQWRIEESEKWAPVKK